MLNLNVNHLILFVIVRKLGIFRSALSYYHDSVVIKSRTMLKNGTMTNVRDARER